jgi:hypothetical protein
MTTWEEEAARTQILQPRGRTPSDNGRMPDQAKNKNFAAETCTAPNRKIREKLSYAPPAEYGGENMSVGRAKKNRITQPDAGYKATMKSLGLKMTRQIEDRARASARSTATGKTRQDANNRQEK